MEDSGYSDEKKEGSSYFESGFSFEGSKRSLSEHADSLQYSGDDTTSDPSRRSKGSSSVEGASIMLYPPVGTFQLKEVNKDKTKEPTRASALRNMPFSYSELTKAVTRAASDGSYHSISLKMAPPAPALVNLERAASASHDSSSTAMYPSKDTIFKMILETSDVEARARRSDPYQGEAHFRQEPGVFVGGTPTNKFPTESKTKEQAPPNTRGSLEIEATPSKQEPFAKTSYARKQVPAFSYPTPGFEAPPTSQTRLTSFDSSLETASDIISNESPATPRFFGGKKSEESDMHQGRSHGGYLARLFQEEEDAAYAGRLQPPSKTFSFASCSPPAIPVRRSSTGYQEEESSDEGAGTRFQEDEAGAKVPSNDDRSVGSNSSGVDLDEKTRNSIIANSASMHIARRRGGLPLEQATSSDDHTVSSNYSGVDLDEKTRNGIIAHATSLHVARRRSSSFQATKEENNNQDDTGSVGSETSGVELDDGTRNKIISRSTSMHVARRRNSSFEDDARAPNSTGRLSLRAIGPTPPTTNAGRATKRNSRRVSTSTENSSNHLGRRTSGTFDKKAAIRATSSSNLAGMLPSAGNGVSKSQNLDGKMGRENDGLPFQPVMTSDLVVVDANNQEESQDIEAQTSAQVVTPGAFAVRPRSADDLEEHGSDYESDFEENTIVTFDNPTEATEPSAVDPNVDEERPALRPVVPAGTPIEAELYEEGDVADAQVLGEESSSQEDPKTAVNKARFMQVFLVVLICAIGASIAIALSPPNGSNRGKVCQHGCSTEIKGWEQMGGVLFGPVDSDSIQFGYSVAISGDGHRVAVGLPGLDVIDDETGLSSTVGGVFVMDNNGTDWNMVAKIRGIEADGNAGEAVAISQDGTRVAFGAPGTRAGGYVALYRESTSGVWELEGGVLKPENATGISSFGSTLALSASGDVMAVGDRYANIGDEFPEAGVVRVYQNTGPQWIQIGSDILGTGASELFGWALDISDDGNRVAASAVGTERSRGEVRIFDFDEEGWVASGQNLVGESDRERFGASLSLSGNGKHLAVGASGYSEKSSNAGRVRTYVLHDDETQEWIATGQSLDGENQFDRFGSAVALSADGSTLAIGSPYSSTFETNAGYIKVMEFAGRNWVQVGSILGREEGESSLFGSAVDISIDGQKVIGGAPDFTYDGKFSKVGLAWAYERDETEE